MKAIIANTPVDVVEAQNRMVGVGAVSISDMPKGSPNLHAGEDRIMRGMEQMDAIVDRYKQAKEYMAWFEPAWNSLTADERGLLEIFYITGGDNRAETVEKICETYRVERTSAYTLKGRAISHLALLLYGR